MNNLIIHYIKPISLESWLRANGYLQPHETMPYLLQKQAG